MACTSRRSPAPWLCAPVVLALVAAAAHAQPRVLDLRQVTGIDDLSIVDLSADGSVVVGVMPDPIRFAAPFRWTEAGGLEPLQSFGRYSGYGPTVSPNGRYVAMPGEYGPASFIQRWGPSGELSLVQSSASGNVTIAISDDGKTIIYRNYVGPWVWREGQGNLPLPPAPCGNFEAVAAAIPRLLAAGSARCGSDFRAAWSRPGASGFFDVPPGTTYSEADEISADGRTVVGNIQSPGYGPVRWVDFGPPEVLPLCPGADYAVALRVSADGRLAVGFSAASSTIIGIFRWTEERGTRDLATELREFGVTLPDTFLPLPDFMSDDGSALGSYGIVIQGLPCPSRPEIQFQPSDTSSCYFSLASLRVEASGVGSLRYQWQTISNEGQWEDIWEGSYPTQPDVAFVGTRTPNLTVPMLTYWVARDYRCIVSNNCGSVISEPAAIRFKRPDLNHDGQGDAADVALLISVIAGGPNPQDFDPDINGDGAADQADIAALVNWIAGGGCP